MIGVVSHDAGGAELLSSYVSRNSLNCQFCLKGPAISVFKRKLGEFELLTLEEVISRSDLLICGTSSHSNLEWEAIKKARELSRYCVVMIDHWVNYLGRFERSGVYHFPDEIWVGDQFALKIAKDVLPNISVKLVENPYFKDLKEAFSSMKQTDHKIAQGLRILYVAEPAGIDAGYTEQEALSFFFEKAALISDKIEQVVVRPHPKDTPGKYEAVMKRCDFPVICENEKTLVDQVASCNVVVGCATMAMVVGILAGKQVFSCIPLGGKTLPLPHKQIRPISHLINSILRI